MNNTRRAATSTEWALTTFEITATLALVIGTLSALAFRILLDIHPRAAGFAVISVIAVSLLASQRVMETGTETDDSSDSSVWLQAILAAVYYNGLVILSGLFALVVFTAGYPRAAFLVAVVYPTWEVISAERMIPLSVSGIAALAAWALGRSNAIIREFLSNFTGFTYLFAEILDLRRFGQKY